jgi:hypothetical protein
VWHYKNRIKKKVKSTKMEIHSEQTLQGKNKMVGQYEAGKMVFLKKR